MGAVVGLSSRELSGPCLGRRARVPAPARVPGSSALVGGNPFVYKNFSLRVGGGSFGKILLQPGFLWADREGAKKSTIASVLIQTVGQERAQESIQGQRFGMTAASEAPGHFDTLSKDEEAKLKEIWMHMLRFWGTPVTVSEQRPAAQSRSSTKASLNGSLSEDKPKKKKFGFLRKGKKSHSSHSEEQELALTTTRTRESIESGYTHKMIHESLKDLQPDDIYKNFWEFLRTDTPDNLMLRFLRARKWDTDKTMAMFSSTLHWRAKESNVDQLLWEGDLKPFQEDANSGFILQLKLSKAYFRGVDREGRPIVVIRPRLHHANEQTEKDLERYTLLVIEICRLVLQEPVDSASIIFDMSGFSLANMEYAPVKFMVGVFEAHYPESLGRLFIHKAPWVFPPIWNIIKNWLDPVVASKIHFTKNLKDLEKHIENKWIPKDIDGGDQFQPTWIEPNPEDDKLMLDTETRDKIKKEREELVQQFIDATVRWIESTNDEENNKWREEKRKLGKALAANYIRLDPYIRSKNNFDRMGCVSLKAPL